MSASSFSRSALVLLFAMATALFALSVLLHAYDTEPVFKGSDKAGPGGYSASALGCAGFYDILRRLDYPVRHGLEASAAQTGDEGLLVYAEPALRHLQGAGEPELALAAKTLLVLPKWKGVPDPKRPSWIAEARPLSFEAVEAILHLAAPPESGVVRQKWPQAWATNEIGITPAGPDTGQFIRSPAMRPVVGGPEGMLVGEIRDRDRILWVLADPDVLNNHGIMRAENAAFAVALIETLRTSGGRDSKGLIVFDESVHGAVKAQNSPVKMLFRFPLVVVPALVSLSALMLVWAGVGRFGAARRPSPGLWFGNERLIANSARLLDYAGHHTSILVRYVRMSIRSAGQALHAPHGLDDESLALWLDRTAASRGLTLSSLTILQTALSLGSGGRSGLLRLFACARNIHRWKGELLHGSARHQRHR